MKFKITTLFHLLYRRSHDHGLWHVPQPDVKQQKDQKESTNHLPECPGRARPRSGKLLSAFVKFKITLELISEHQTSIQVLKLINSLETCQILKFVFVYLQVICDEGHILKNVKSILNVAVNRIATRRRIILTGKTNSETNWFFSKTFQSFLKTS
jgi:hypothetical protein